MKLITIIIMLLTAAAVRPLPGAIKVQEGTKWYYPDVNRTREYRSWNNRSISFPWGGYDRCIELSMIANATIQVLTLPSKGYLTYKNQIIQKNFFKQGRVELCYFAHSFESNTNKASDRFKYRIADGNETWSQAIEIPITIKSGLQGLNTSDVGLGDEAATVGQGGGNVIYVYGLDDSHLNRRIRYQITHIPPSTHGTLVDSPSGQPVSPGSTLSKWFEAPYDQSASVRFHRAKGFHGATFFRFIVIAVDKRGNILSISDEVTQYIFVEEKYNKPEITGPTKPAQVVQMVYPLPPSLNQACLFETVLENITDTGSHNCSVRLIVPDITVNNLGTAPKRVQVRTKNPRNRVCLNPIYREKADTASCYENEHHCGSLKCDSSEINALVYPSDVNNVLANISFQGIATGEDMLVVEVFDGVGPECLDSRWLLNYTSPVECTKAEFLINITVHEKNYYHVQEEQERDFKWLMTMISGSLTVFFFLALLIIFCCVDAPERHDS